MPARLRDYDSHVGIFQARSAFAAGATVLSGNLSRFAPTGTSQTSQFESELAAHVGVPHARAVNSGTSALICGLVGLGVGPGDEVLVPAYTWVSTAAAVLAVGAVPILVEIDDTLTIDIDDLTAKITPSTRAVIPVHMLNLVCDMDAIMKTANQHGLAVLEDACQAIGVTYRGQQVGSFGTAGAFSFNQHKNLRSGEGGAIVCQDSDVFERASMFHDVGSYVRPGHDGGDGDLLVGMNYRMPEVISAILRPQLKGLDRQIARRQRRRAVYIDALSDVEGLTIARHHAQAEATGLVVQFDEPERAKRFAEARGVTLLSETGRHVYSSWEPILVGKMHHDRFAPYEWADAAPPTADACPRTLEFTTRSCGIALAPDLPLPVVRRFAKELTRHT